MEILNLEGTEDTPKIILDKKNGIFEISGRSLPEDSAEFYRPVLEWIENYGGQANPSTDFVFKLEYFNLRQIRIMTFVFKNYLKKKIICYSTYIHKRNNFQISSDL